VYRYYFDLTDNGKRALDVTYVTGAAIHDVTADWVLVHGPGTGLPSNYTLALDQRTGPPPLGDRITVWRHA
jgi:hypothetical protein